MENRQYSIGEFASMNKVSSRMLRHYDKIGLLRPASILPNGYRCYRDEQISAISQIKQLRACGFLLDEIDKILQNNSQQFLSEKAKHKLVDLQGQAIQQQTVIQALSELMTEHSSVAMAFPPIYGISVAARNGTNLLTQKQAVSMEGVDTAFEKLFCFIQQQKLHPTGCTVLLNRIGSQADTQNRVGISILESYHDECYVILPLPAASVLSVIHYGDYYTIGHAYSALLNYAEQNSYLISNMFMERYFIDSSHDAVPNEYVTEISVALKNTP